jgi:hypothetical protein
MRLTRTIPNTLGALLLVAVVFTAYTAQQAFATHQPADKVHAAGSDVERFGPAKRVELLRQQLKVSSPSDLILQLTAECGILTDTETGADDSGGPDEQSDSDFANGQVRVWVEVDGKPVPVTAAADDGSIVLCNRDQTQTANESEEQQDPECQVGGVLGQAPESCDDGLDALELYQLTRTANGFNWFAINGGTFYDSPVNGNNILDIVVYGDLDVSCSDEGEDCAEAFVGNRTLIIEPVHASNDESLL